jgi:hypothetical protein
MAHIVANLPPINAFIRKEFLYDFQSGHGELVPCWWVSIKSLPGQAFRIESYLNEYGALYDKLPLHAYCWKPVESNLYPLDYLQIWNCFSHDIAIIKKAAINSMKCKIKLKNNKWEYGEYMFTVDSAHADINVLDVGFSEDVENHKSFNFIKLDNGQFAAQPNNRLIVFEPSSNPKELKKSDFKIATKKWSVEAEAKWALGDTNSYMYEQPEEINR